jgi:hypothetical protein
MKEKLKNYENDLFITLIQVSQENDNIGKILKYMINLDKSRRIILIDDIVNKMEKNNENTELIEAFILLKDDEIIKIIKKIKL